MGRRWTDPETDRHRAPHSLLENWNIDQGIRTPQMKIRLLGSADLVRAAAEALERAGVPGREYPSRNGPQELRWYGDVDDRLFAEILEKSEAAASGQKSRRRLGP